MNVGWGEFFMLAVIILIIFSASRMGSLGNSLGKFVYSFKKASKGDDFIDVKPSSKLSSSGNNQPIEDAHIIDEKKG